MRTIKSLLMVVALLLITTFSFAHALWIEVNPKGQQGQSQEIRIYYGEFATGELEPVDKWYSDVKEFSLWLVAPGQKSQKVNVIAKDNYYLAQFTPKGEGTYYLTVVHEAAEIASGTKYEFSSVAQVKVGKNTVGTGTPDAVQNSLKVIYGNEEVKIGTATKIQLFLDGKPYKNGKVIVASESGWAKTFTADESGEVKISPIWKGKYVLEATNFKTGKGELKGKTYESTWQGATTVLYVN